MPALSFLRFLLSVESILLPSPRTSKSSRMPRSKYHVSYPCRTLFENYDRVNIPSRVEITPLYLSLRVTVVAGCRWFTRRCHHRRSATSRTRSWTGCGWSKRRVSSSSAGRRSRSTTDAATPAPRSLSLCRFTALTARSADRVADAWRLTTNLRISSAPASGFFNPGKLCQPYDGARQGTCEIK